MAMKTVIILALVACQAAALAPATAKKPLAAQANKTGNHTANKTKIHVDASEATSQLQELMAQASNSLAKAERHHERQVQKARKALETALDSEAKVLGGAVSRYNKELQHSADELQRLVDASKAAVKEDEARYTGSWGNDPGMEARARLGAQADMAAREVRKAKRQHDRLLQEAQGRAEEPLDDTTYKLSRKVGDLSEVISSAKSLLDTQAASVDDDEDAVKPSGNTTSNKTVNGTKHLEELAVDMKTALAKHRTDLADAEKKLNQVVANSTKTLAAGSAKIEKGLDEQEQKEIKKVRDGAKMPPIGSKKPAKQLRATKPANKKDDAAMKSLVEMLSKAFKGAKKTK